MTDNWLLAVFRGRLRKSSDLRYISNTISVNLQNLWSCPSKFMHDQNVQFLKIILRQDATEMRRLEVMSALSILPSC